MNAKAQRWGNSLAVKLPKALAEALGIQEHDALRVEVKDGILQLIPQRRRLDLQRLVKAITPQNRHGESGFGLRRGREGL